MTAPAVLREGAFDPRVRTYWLLSPTIVLALSVVLIPIIPVYLLIAWLLVDRWHSAMRCTLTTRNLVIKKGLLNRVESTVPLEKITDLQMYQGPVMRMLGLKGFRVETAGQSSGPGGHLINLIGLVDTEGFREAVLEQRDRLSEGAGMAGRSTPTSEGDAGELLAVAREIRDALSRIEARIDRG